MRYFQKRFRIYYGFRPFDPKTTTGGMGFRARSDNVRSAGNDHCSSRCRRPNKNATTWITILNLVTGLFSVGGALGYSLRKNWGLGAFGISVLGHIINHGYLMVSLIHVGRASVAG